MLDYKSVAIFSTESASIQNDQRKQRWENKIFDGCCNENSNDNDKTEPGAQKKLEKNNLKKK